MRCGIWIASALILCTVTFGVVFYSDHQAGSLLFSNSDFELGNLTNWEGVGEAFVGQPLKSDLAWNRRRQRSMMQGAYWVGTFSETKGDSLVGTLTSTEFTIRRPTITFLIGGGSDSAQTSVELWVEGQKTLETRGLGSITETESMIRVRWDVSQWMHHRARLLLKDQSTTGWGHLNFDDCRYL